MNTVSEMPAPGRADRLNYIFHASFEDCEAERLYGSPLDSQDGRGFMPDEMTREWAKRMHYAAWRASRATTRREATRWRGAYHESRNCIVVGNRKLIYRAVQKRTQSRTPTDDLAGECHIVLIKAVAAFNPWLGIRFSTYAFTCLMRAVSRLSQRMAMDRLSRSQSLDTLPSAEPACDALEDAIDPRLTCLGEFFREDSALLTAREKLVISRRYRLNDRAPRSETLEQVGRDLGLSKERVRQVQKAALLKLRGALLSAVPVS